MNFYIRFLFGFLLLSFTPVGCEGGIGPTPPIAGPSANAPAPESIPTTPLPLHAVEASSAMPSVDSRGSREGSLITAVPALIYTLDSGKIAESVITVEKGTFPSHAVITVWGEVPQSKKVSTGKMYFEVVLGMNRTQVVLSSPPSIIGADLDPAKADIQLYASSDGGLQFTLLAGNSTGTFTLQIAYPEGNIRLTTFVIISQ